jgi:hypothetical protein
MAGESDIIKEFLVSLGFQVNQAGLNKFTGALAGTTKTALTAGKAVVGIAAAAQTMVIAFSSQMEKLYYASRRTDASVENLQALDFGFRKIGLGAGVAREAMEAMASAVRMNPGLRGLADRMLGKSTEGLDQAKVMLELVEHWGKMPHFQGAGFAQMFGMDEKTFLMLKQGMPELLKAEEERRNLNKSLGLDAEKAAEAAKEYQNMWRDILEKTGAIGQKWSVEILPYAKAFAEHIDHALDRLSKFSLSETVDKAKHIIDKQDPEETKKRGLSLVGNVLSNTLVGKMVEGTVGKYLKYSGPTGPRESSGQIKNLGQSETSGQAAPTMFNRLESTFGLPSGLLDRVWNKESGRGKNMRSPKGAEGHFQFMPATAKQYGVNDPYNLAQAAEGAARYYADLLKKYNGDLSKAAAAYNWGPGNLDKYGLGAAPSETRNYMAAIASEKGSNDGKQVVISQKTDIHVSGAESPSETARQVSRVQDEVTGNMVRNMRGAIS